MCEDEKQTQRQKLVMTQFRVFRWLRNLWLSPEQIEQRTSFNFHVLWPMSVREWRECYNGNENDSITLCSIYHQNGYGDGTSKSLCVCMPARHPPSPALSAACQRGCPSSFRGLFCSFSAGRCCSL